MIHKIIVHIYPYHRHHHHHDIKWWYIIITIIIIYHHIQKHFLFIFIIIDKQTYLYLSYLYIYIYIYIFTLVGGLEHVFYFPFSWECHHPNWRTHIFQRGRYTTNQNSIQLYLDYVRWFPRAVILLTLQCDVCWCTWLC